MSIELRLVGETSDDILRELRVLSAGLCGTPIAPPAATTTAVETKRTTRTVKEPAPAAGPTGAASAAVDSASAKASPPTDATPASVTTASAATSPSEAVVDLATVRAFLSPFLADPDKAPLVTGLLQEFGAAKLSGIDAARLPALLAKAKETFK